MPATTPSDGRREVKEEMGSPLADNRQQQGTGWPRSIAVIGAAGLIGSGVVYQLALTGIGETIHLVDVKENVARAHEIDISEAQVLAGVKGPKLHVLNPDNAGSVDRADLVIVAASAPEVPGGDRREFLSANLRLLRKLAPTIEQLAGTGGIVLLLSNPVDVLAKCLHRITSIAADRILGYSINDSVRFRAAVARVLDIEPHRVQAQVLGEHGKGQVPIFSSVAVDGKTVPLTAAQQQDVRQDIDGWFDRWSALEPGRSSGWTTPLGVARMIEMMAAEEVFPAAAWTGGTGGMTEAFIAIPVKMAAGRVKASSWRGTPEEQAAMAEAAKSVRETADLALAADADGGWQRQLASGPAEKSNDSILERQDRNGIA